jgi:hypothetical protein
MFSAAFTIVLLVYLGFTCLLGGLCGAVASRVLRLRWNATIFLQDMAFAGLACFLSAAVFIEIENRRLTPIERGDAYISPWIFVVIGSAVPLVRHLIRFVISQRDRAASPAK